MSQLLYSYLSENISLLLKVIQDQGSEKRTPTVQKNSGTTLRAKKRKKRSRSTGSGKKNQSRTDQRYKRIGKSKLPTQNFRNQP